MAVPLTPPMDTACSCPKPRRSTAPSQSVLVFPRYCTRLGACAATTARNWSALSMLAPRTTFEVDSELV